MTSYPDRGKRDRAYTLLPGFRDLVEKVIKDLEALGWQPIVAEGRRTVAEQKVKVQKGYSQTMKSDHILGRAADVVDKRYFWQAPCDKLDHQFWKDLGACAKKHGLQWGGDWKSFKDVAHIYSKKF